MHKTVRKNLLDKLLILKDENLIKVVTGAQHFGKSTLFIQNPKPFEILEDYILFLKNFSLSADARIQSDIPENSSLSADSRTQSDVSENSPLLEGCQTQSDGVFKRTEGNTPSFGHPSKRTEGRFKKYKQLPYNPKLKERAKALRKQGILSEVLFWKAVKNKQFLGLNFHRQKIIGNYIVDFYCPVLDLVIEIDGSSHDNKGEYDEKRDKYLKSLGLHVIHFDDREIKKDLNSVITELERYCEGLLNTPSFGHPSKRGERDTPSFGHSSERKEGGNLPLGLPAIRKELFEKIIEAMVMELYFEEELHEQDLYFIKYVERDFKPIENLQSDKEKITVINEVYQVLQQKDNEIHNNLKLMNSKLPDIVGVIKNKRQ